MSITLYHVAVSNYSEKVRFALQYKGIPYTDLCFPLGAQYPVVLALSGQRQVPLLTMNGRVLVDSTHIIEALEQEYPFPPLYPQNASDRAEALAWEDRLDEHFGTAVRFMQIDAMRRSPDKLVAFAGPLARLIPPVLNPFLNLIFQAASRTDGLSADQARRQLEQTLDDVAARVKSHGFLAGGRFTVADLTFAALGSMLFVPERYFSSLPSEMHQLVAHYADHPAVLWARDLYAGYRREKALKEAAAATHGRHPAP